jgi:hypothetical protein
VGGCFLLLVSSLLVFPDDGVSGLLELCRFLDELVVRFGVDMVVISQLNVNPAAGYSLGLVR